MKIELLPIVPVKRVYLQHETLGSLFFEDQMLCKTMELPWRENRRSVSCIPEGDYITTKEEPIEVDNPETPVDESGGRKPRNYWHFRLHDVPGRSGVLIHKITYVDDLRGCLGVGMNFKDLNGDDILDMVESTAALHKLVEILPDKFILRIQEK